MVRIHLVTITGEPSPPTDLVLTLPPWGLGVILSWTPGFALIGEEVSFVIVSEELGSGVITEFLTEESSSRFLPVSDTPTCQRYRFTVYAENGFSRSGVSEEMLLPAGNVV